MRGFCFSVAVAALLGPFAVAQEVPPPVVTPGQVQPARTPPGAQTASQSEKKLRDLCARLNLTDDQKGVVENLFMIYHAELEEAQQNPMKLLDDIRFKLAELKEAQHALAKAREEKDEARIAELTATEARLKTELANTAPVRRAELHFFDGLLPILTDPQKKQFERIRRRLEATSENTVKPVQVLRMARGLDLDSTQQEQLGRIEQDFRNRMATERVTTDGISPAVLEELIGNVRAILNPSQAERFDDLLETPEARRSQPEAAPDATPAKPDAEGAKP